MYAEQSTSLRDILTYFRQHRTEIVVQMRSQIFRQIVQKFCRHTDVCQKIYVQDAGKYASRCAAKPSGGLCAVLPKDNEKPPKVMDIMMKLMGSDEVAYSMFDNIYWEASYESIKKKFIRKLHISN